MKKIGKAILICSMLLGLVGCGQSDIRVLTPDGNAVIREDGSSSNSSKTQAKEDNSEPEKIESKKKEGKGNSELLHIGFAQVGSESDWRLAQTTSMKETFTEDNGYSLDFVDCNNDQQAQLDALNDFVEKGVDYIILDPIVETGYDDVLKKAKDAGIPVIVVDRNISAPKELYTCWVGSDFNKEGVEAANWLAE